MPQHGIELVQFLDALEQGLDFSLPRLVLVPGAELGEFDHQLLPLWQELVQRRIQSADDDGKAVHDLEEVDEVLPLHRQQLAKGLGPSPGILGQDHLPNVGDPLRLEEHVLGAAEADPFRAECASHARVARGLGIGADAGHAMVVHELHEAGEVA